MCVRSKELDIYLCQQVQVVIIINL